MYKSESNPKDEILQLDTYKSRTTSINSLLSSVKKDGKIF
jgi:hypothetical protein